MIQKNKKLPGVGTRVLSFLPLLNFIALIILGIKTSTIVSFICGIIYCIVSFLNPETLAIFWIISIVQYDYTINKLECKKKYSALTANKEDFTDIILDGEEEYNQSIPIRNSTYSSDIRVSFYDARNNFFEDMKKYALKNGEYSLFEPFMDYWPSYESMTESQKAWYFYWRTEVRNEKYPDTDLSYIFIYIYEILSRIGWETPSEGYNQLIKIWKAYQERHPKLDNYLYNWTFDFANQYNLEYKYNAPTYARRMHPSPMVDVLIDKHYLDAPLKLPFELICVLCDYSLIGSKFYKDGHSQLIQEAIFRVVALVDAILRKKTQKGILDTYGPVSATKQDYYLYSSAVCSEANTIQPISIKAYSSNTKLRTYINELVRFAENVLRELRNYRGRLRGITVDDETAKLVEAFLKKEYGIVLNNKTTEKKEVILDQNKIDVLRKQSDDVRIKLEVPEISVTIEKELLTDIKEVTLIYLTLSSNARALLDRLNKSNWEDVEESGDMQRIAEINRLSEHNLGSPLLVRENNTIIVEEDYQDELTFIYDNPPQKEKLSMSNSIFDLSILTGEFLEFIQSLTLESQKALHVIVLGYDVEKKLAIIAEDESSMPQILLDDINEVAMRFLGNIVIDTIGEQPCIVDEYLDILKQSAMLQGV